MVSMLVLKPSGIHIMLQFYWFTNYISYQLWRRDYKIRISERTNNLL